MPKSFAEIKNISDSDIIIDLMHGPEVTLPPGSSLKNVRICGIDTIANKVSVKEDLTEVLRSGGKTRIDERTT